MVIINSFHAFSNTSEVGESSYTGNSRADTLCVEVTGSATAIQLTVLGLVDYKQEEYTTLSGISLNDYSVVQTITEKGIYQFPIEGLAHFKLKLAAVSGGKISVYCRTTCGG